MLGWSMAISSLSQLPFLLFSAEYTSYSHLLDLTLILAALALILLRWFLFSQIKWCTGYHLYRCCMGLSLSEFLLR